MQMNVVQSSLSNFIVKLSTLPLLNTSRVEKLGGFLLMSLGSLLSPVWPLLNGLMKPLMSIVFSVENPIKGYILLIHHLREIGPHDIFFNFQLPMTGLTLLHFVFIIACYKLGHKLTRQALEKAEAQKRPNLA